MLTVYGNLRSTCTRKVLMTLREKEQHYEFVAIDLAKGEQKSAEHLQRHPFGVIPAIKDGNFSLYESRAIIRYLDHRFPQPKLTPSDNNAFGLMEQWLSVEQSYFSSFALQVIKKIMWGYKIEEAIVEEAKVKVNNALAIADKALANQPYFAGEQFSLADITWMPYVDYLLVCNVNDLFADKPHFMKWWETVSQRPTWGRAKGG